MDAEFSMTLQSYHSYWFSMYLEGKVASINENTQLVIPKSHLNLKMALVCPTQLGSGLQLKGCQHFAYIKLFLWLDEAVKSTRFGIDYHPKILVHFDPFKTNC